MSVKNRVSEYDKHLDRAVELSRELACEHECRQKKKSDNGRKTRSEIEAKPL
ncbi:MAG: hypothetical protein GY941_27575 [Planctomycetes bacterium]|nr:hypothetical protein [Planctomycetota bacterium]